MTSSAVRILEQASRRPVSESVAYHLVSQDVGELREAACMRRDAFWGKVVTYSPKVFVPVTNLCRNSCSYCSFRRCAGDPEERTMHPDEIVTWLERARVYGCVEALLCLGGTPEARYSHYRSLLRSWGYNRTVDYLRWIAERALEAGLLPHTNAGVLSSEDMLVLKRVNVSLGLMLESTSERLCHRGMPHHCAPDKRPTARVRMLREAGELRVPFTTGLLLGIGETIAERVDTILTIRRLHRQYGHIGEIIIQRFRAHPSTSMGQVKEPDVKDVCATIALARLVVDDQVSIQAPPNLSPGDTAALLRAGINDFGGISALSCDHINPQHPWPHLCDLQNTCEAEGFRLVPRLPISPFHIDAPGFVNASLRPYISSVAGSLQSHDHYS